MIPSGLRTLAMRQCATCARTGRRRLPVVTEPDACRVDPRLQRGGSGPSRVARQRGESVGRVRRKGRGKLVRELRSDVARPSRPPNHQQP